MQPVRPEAHRDAPFALATRARKQRPDLVQRRPGDLVARGGHLREGAAEAHVHEGERSSGELEDGVGAARPAARPHGVRGLELRRRRPGLGGEAGEVPPQRLLQEESGTGLSWSSIVSWTRLGIDRTLRREQRPQLAEPAVTGRWQEKRSQT